MDDPGRQPLSTLKTIGWVEDSIYQTPDEVLLGAMTFVEQHPGWEIRVSSSWGNVWDSIPLAGLVGGIDSDIHHYAVNRSLPFVSLVPNGSQLCAACVLVDRNVAAKLALSHLAERNLSFMHFFFSFDQRAGLEPWQLEKVLMEVADDYNITVQVVPEGERVKASGWSLSKQLEDLGECLAAAPRPAALLAMDLEHGQRALAAAKQAGYLVPDDLSIMVVSGSNIRCELSDPPLTNVMPDRFAMGYHAAKTIYEIAEGIVSPDVVLRVPPRGVVARRSSDFLAVDDPLVRQAMRWIDANVQHSIDVADVVDAVNVSRATLHRRFIAALGSGPQQMIRRAMVRRASALLTTTDLPIIEIAARTGFAHPTQLSRDMKKLTGQNPTDIRRKRTIS